MRFFAFYIFALSACIILLPSQHAAAQDLQLEDNETPQAPETPNAEDIVPQIDDVPLASEDTKTENKDRLETLFASLRKTRSEQAARRIANNIWGEWFKSGSASIDLMMHWSNEAMQRNDYNIALDYLDQVVTKMPDYAEGWNRRATLHFSMRNYNKSMVDIQKTLSLEPRHFGAWSGMATILERTGKKEAALKAWQQALKVYPAMKSGQAALLRLFEELEGDPA